MALFIRFDIVHFCEDIHDGLRQSLGQVSVSKAAYRCCNYHIQLYFTRISQFNPNGNIAIHRMMYLPEPDVNISYPAYVLG